MAREASLRSRLELELPGALEKQEFEMHYQHIVDLSCERTKALEALVRWQHPSEGLILPDRFIPQAEQSGLICALGEWIVRRSCAQAATWPGDVRVAVNVSPAQFTAGNLFDVIMSALAETDLAPDRLEIEITERVLLADRTAHVATLHQLKDVGVGIALDDFGTGYSSLSYLKAFPFDKIKIDRSFTCEILEDGVSAAIVCAVANLSRSLGVQCVAEGVETPEQATALRAAGVTQGQGYLFSRPMPADQLRLHKVAESPPDRLRARRSGCS
jgi:EAL domain-containing protein (putative c-di-GMP-specific phosphodiesterase class I)